MLYGYTALVNHSRSLFILIQLKGHQIPRPLIQRHLHVTHPLAALDDIPQLIHELLQEPGHAIQREQHVLRTQVATDKQDRGFNATRSLLCSIQPLLT